MSPEEIYYKVLEAIINYNQTREHVLWINGKVYEALLKVIPNLPIIDGVMYRSFSLMGYDLFYNNPLNLMGDKYEILIVIKGTKNDPLGMTIKKVILDD